MQVSGQHGQPAIKPLENIKAVPYSDGALAHDDKLRDRKVCVVNSPSFESMRTAMIVSQIRTTGVNDPRILAAMGTVPREDFVEEGRRAVAYADLATPVGNGRALLPPEVLGRLLEKADLTGGEQVLVIGGGTGYSAAVLAAMGAEVTLLESDPALAARAAALLGKRVRVVEGDLAKGAKKGAPFDFILIDGAAEEIPEALIKLLRDGGKLAAVEIDGQGVGRAAIGVRSGDGFGLRQFADAPAAEPLPGFQRARAFQF